MLPGMPSARHLPRQPRACRRRRAAGRRAGAGLDAQQRIVGVEDQARAARSRRRHRARARATGGFEAPALAHALDSVAQLRPLRGDRTARATPMKRPSRPNARRPAARHDGRLEQRAAGQFCPCPSGSASVVDGTVRPAKSLQRSPPRRCAPVGTTGTLIRCDSPGSPSAAATARSGSRYAPPFAVDPQRNALRWSRRGRYRRARRRWTAGRRHRPGKPNLAGRPCSERSAQAELQGQRTSPPADRAGERADHDVAALASAASSRPSRSSASRRRGERSLAEAADLQIGAARQVDLAVAQRRRDVGQSRRLFERERAATAARARAGRRRSASGAARRGTSP